MGTHQLNEEAQTPIAHFSLLRFSLWAAVCLAIYAALGYDILERIQNPANQLLLEVVGLLVIILGLWLIFLVLCQITAHAALAVWTQNSSIFYLNHYGSISFTKIPLKVVDSVRVGSLRFWQPTGLVLVLKNGNQKYMPTVLLREKRNDTLVRILSFVSIPRTGYGAEIP